MPTLDDVYQEIRDNATYLAETVQFYQDRIDALRGQKGVYAPMEMRNCEQQRDRFQAQLRDHEATLRILATF